jgi:capsular exopolysaccharide synthesis family protein
MVERPGSPEAEAFRVLETNMRFASIDRPARSIMVTSSVQGEGKSTTIGNLAVAMARAGQNVILVDLDLRRPATRKLFDLPGGPGLTDVLLGNVSAADAIATIDLAANGRGDTLGSLRVLGAGTPPPNPGELIGPNGGVARLLAQFESEADVVLVDAPPALVVGDALALTAIVDAVFLCVRLKVVTRGMLDEVALALEKAHAAPLGYVVTGQAQGAAGYGYGYSYSAAAGGSSGAPEPESAP